MYIYYLYSYTIIFNHSHLLVSNVSLSLESNGRCSVPLSDRMKQHNDYGEICDDNECARGPVNLSVFASVIDDSVYKMHNSVESFVLDSSEEVYDLLVEWGQYADPRSIFFEYMCVPHVIHLPCKRQATMYLNIKKKTTSPCVIINNGGITTDVPRRLEVYRGLRKSMYDDDEDEEDEDDADFVLPDEEDEMKSSTVKAEQQGSTDNEFDRTLQMTVAVRHDRIPLEPAKKIADVRVALLSKIRSSTNIPAGMKRLWENFHTRRWLEAGGYRGIDRQLVEIGVQEELDLPIQGEAWGWKEKQFQDQRSLGIKISNELIRLFEANGVTKEDRTDATYIELVGTWPTAARPATATQPRALSTGPTTFEYIVGKDGNWRDIEPKPCHKYEKGMGTKKTFDSSCYDTDKSDRTYCSRANRLGESSKDGKFRLVDADTNHWLYKNRNEPIRIWQEAGFEQVQSSILKEEFGDEIILLKSGKTFVLLHDHYSIAGDSRNVITSKRSQPRAITADVSHNVVRYARGEIDTITSENYHDNATFGSNAMSYCREALHGYPKACAVWYRDSLLQLYDPDTLAMHHFGGSKTPEGDAHYPSSRAARKKLKTESKKFLTVIEVTNILMYVIDTADLYETLDYYDEQFSLTMRRDVATGKWQTIYKYLEPCLLPIGREEINKWAATRQVRLVPGDFTTVPKKKSGNKRSASPDDEGEDPTLFLSLPSISSVATKMKQFQFDPSIEQFAWLVKNKQQPKKVPGLYMGEDKKHGHPVFLMHTGAYGNGNHGLKEQSWKLVKVLIVKQRGVQEYVGNPGFPRDERDNLVLYKFQQKDDEDACSKPKKKKGKAAGKSK